MLRNIVVLFLLLLPINLQAKECVGLVTAGDVNRPFWAEIVKGAIAAADELNIDLHFRGVSRESKENSQKLIIDHILKTHQCAGFILAPAGKSLNETVEELVKKGVTVTYIDRDMGGDRSSVVKSDNYNAGVLAARKMAQVLNGKKNIALLRLKKGLSSTDDRELGFIQEAHKLGLKVVIDEYLGVTIGEARSRALTIFASQPSIDGIFTPNGMTTEGVMKALEHINLVPSPLHIGFDETEYIVEKVKTNHLHGYIKQAPFKIGYYGVHSLYKALRGDKYAPYIGVPVIFVSKKDLVQR